MAIPKKPKLLYQVTIQRKRYFRRFAWCLLAAIAGFGALVGLNTAFERNEADSTVLVVGIVIAGIVGAIFIVRALANLVRWLRLRDETLSLYDQGIVRVRAGQQAKYGWSALQTYREAGRGVYLRDKPVVQWGADTLTMQDGSTLKITSKYGDLRKLGSLLRRPAAHVTGIQMGKTLREEKPVKLNPQLTVWPGGVQVGKQEIHWSEVDVRLKGNNLTIYQKTKAGKFQKVRQFNTRKMDNVGGFMEVATATIRNHQRERFGV